MNDRLLLLAFALLLIAARPAGAAAPGPAFLLEPAPRPVLAAVAEVAAEQATVLPEADIDARLWNTPPDEDWDGPTPQPGEWRTSIDPELDLGPAMRDPRSELALALDPIRIDSLTLRVTRHF